MSRVVVFDEFGGPEVLHIVDEPVVEPAAGEVRVKVEAFAVNPLDQMMRSGSSPAPVELPHARLGVEGTGVIDALGSETAGLRIGDPVIITAIPDAAVNGSYAEHVTIPASRVIARPTSLGVAEAAAIWVGYSTAYGALVETARMRPGDRVLITAASGSVGRAAIQIADRVGAVPIAITRHAAKRDELLAAGAAAVIATDHENLADAVHHHTDGTGADIVLDLVMGPGQQDLVTAAGPGATPCSHSTTSRRPTATSSKDTIPGRSSSPSRRRPDPHGDVHSPCQSVCFAERRSAHASRRETSVAGAWEQSVHGRAGGASGSPVARFWRCAGRLAVAMIEVSSRRARGACGSLMSPDRR